MSQFESGDGRPVQPTPGSSMSRRELREQEALAARTPRQRRPEQPGGHESAPRRRRRWPWVLGSIAVVLALLIGAGVVVANQYGDRIAEELGWSTTQDFTGAGDGEEIDFVVAEGELGSDIANNLVELGVTASYDAFYDLMLAQDPQPTFYPGSYALQGEMSAQAALDVLLDPANRVTASVLIREGLTAEQIYEQLAADTGVPLEDIRAAAVPADYSLPAELTSLDGYLFPATYSFDPGTEPATMISAMVNRMISALDQRGIAPEDRHRVLTIASIIEREARLPEDFGRVARVIENRLAAGMPLQMDSTAQFGVAGDEGSVWSSELQLTDENPWNTYVIQGLPLGPISAPGDTAIDAVLNPPAGDWVYFVTVNLETGETVFTTTLEEHEAAVQQLRDWCSANSDFGACG